MFYDLYIISLLRRKNILQKSGIEYTNVDQKDQNSSSCSVGWMIFFAIACVASIIALVLVTYSVLPLVVAGATATIFCALAIGLSLVGMIFVGACECQKDDSCFKNIFSRFTDDTHDHEHVSSHKDDITLG